MLLQYGATGVMAVAVVVLAWVTFTLYRKIESLYEARLAEAKAYADNYQKLVIVTDRLGEMVEEMKSRGRR